MPGYSNVAASPWDEDLVLAGEFERAAHVWSLHQGAEVACIDTVHDFGGRRLALVTGAQPMVIAGAYERQGVCGYSLTGERVWQNRARSAVQHLTGLACGRVAVGYARGPAVVLEASSGKELRSLRGAGPHRFGPGASIRSSAEGGIRTRTPEGTRS